MKKTISFLLCLLLVLGMMPVGALAAEEIVTQPADSTPVVQSEDTSTLTVYVNGKDVKEIEDDTISWNEETKTLTLNNANILAENGTYKGSGIYVIGSDTLVLELVGENTVEGKFNGSDEFGKSVDDIFVNAAISVTEGLTIRGDGSLTATDLAVGSDTISNPIRSAGIFTGGDMTIESGTIHAVGNSSGYSSTASAGIFIGDHDSASTLSVSGGTVNATGTSNGIIAYDTIRISGGTVNATGENNAGLHVFDHILNGFGTTYISGGTVTLRGDGTSADTVLGCSGYKNVMWTTVEGGPMNYNSVFNMAGLMSDYLRIEPADLRLVQPSAQNQYTTDVENLSGEEVTAEYRWYQVHSQPITSENVATAEVCTYDEITGLWTIPSVYEADISILTWAAEPGDIVTLEFQNPKEGLLAAITNSVMFEDLGGGVFTHTVVEGDFDSKTGLFKMGIGSEHEIQVKISSAAAEEVQTTSDYPNRFSSDAPGTYFCRATVSQNGTVKAVLDSDHFDYLPVNTVTFDPNGGTCETESAQTQEGLHTLAVLPEATLTGHTFIGWFDAPEGGNQITTDTVFTEDTTVYAQYTLNSYTVTWYPFGSRLEELYPYGAIIEGFTPERVYISNEFQDGWYDFECWRDCNTDAEIILPFTMPAHNLEIFAYYFYTGWHNYHQVYMNKNTEVTGWFCVNDKNELVTDGSGTTYYAGEDSMVVTDITQIDGVLYAFDHETGAFLADYTGTYQALNGDVYYIKNGVAVDRCQILDHADEDNSGRCDHCGILMQDAKLCFASISMNGNIAINYYMLLSDAVLSDETAYMEFTMADGQIVQIPVSQGIKAEYNDETYYVFSCAVDAKEMTDDVVCRFFYEGGSTAPFTYNVQTYANNILEKSSNEDMKALVKAMLNYGAASQTHFGYHTERLANAGLEAPDYSGVTIEGFSTSLGQGTENAKFYSASLLLKSETTLRFFFDAPITATCNGVNLEVKQRSGLYYVDVVGIAAKDLDEDVTITINDGENTADISFNPMAYCQGVLNDTTGAFDQEMKDLVRALYLYNQAANVYFKEI